MRDDQLRSTYEGWVRDYAADLFRAAARLCGQRDVAEELVQETFYEAWRSVRSLHDIARARMWLLTILRRRYARWVRDETRKPRNNRSLETDCKRIGGTADGSAGELLDQLDELQAALNVLDDRYKLPFLLVFLEGMTCEQTARFLDLPLGTVLSRIHRARTRLRMSLAPHEQPAATLKLHRSNDEPSDGPNIGLGGAS
jgi:RNA polymerase sigma-70 factor (ECF subfamily)